VTTAPATRELPVTTSSGAVPTVGVEEQFMLLWPDGEAASIAPELLGRLPGEIRARAEFARYRVESATGGCAELAAVGRNLSIARRVLAEAAADLGARLVAVGTPPFGVPGAEVTCACHVTVELPDRDLGVAVLERLQPWLPALLALTGNSPLWRGHDTGWSSYRFVVQRRWPTFVPRPRSADAAEYDERVADPVADPGWRSGSRTRARRCRTPCSSRDCAELSWGPPSTTRWPDGRHPTSPTACWAGAPGPRPGGG
jgi:carboxylate-amine ligase